MASTAASGSLGSEPETSEPETSERILDATLAVLARDGIAGVTMRAVARQAEVAVGLANYHFDGKTALISAALQRVGDQDMDLVTPIAGGTASDQLRTSLRRAVDPAYLTPEYLSLRLQLWSLAGVDPAYAAINQQAQQRYLAGLAALLAAARPDLDSTEIDRRSTDILITQNGVWLTAVLITDTQAVARALARTETLAFE